MIFRSARYIRGDLSLAVAELQRGDGRARRRHRSPDAIPVVQVADIDFSYGDVQILFDVSFEVRTRRGAGAARYERCRQVDRRSRSSPGSSHRSAASSASTAGRSRSRRPEQRAELGIEMLPGGAGVFRSLSVRDNLLVGAYRYRRDRGDVERRIDQGVRAVPDARERRRTCGPATCRAASSRCWRSARVMLHEPELLVIDELSLGLAPSVVQQLLAMIEQLKAAGQTMIIVEQSLNVAVAVADRAVFMEKGRVRFEGPHGSCSSATIWPERCSSAPRAADPCWRPVGHDAARLQRCGERPADRPAGDGDGARLPIDPGHQLRGRQHRARRCDAAAAAGARLRLSRTGSASRSCLLCGTLFAAVVELIVIRRLFDAPRVIVLVATVGIAQLAAGVAAVVPRSGGQRFQVPAADRARLRGRRRTADHRHPARRARRRVVARGRAAVGALPHDVRAHRSRRPPTTRRWRGCRASTRSWSRRSSGPSPGWSRRSR